MPLGDRPVYLIGFMGCGKTVAGRSLASRLGWEYEDTDDRVVDATGKTIEQIFAESGEDRFRRLEWEALRDLPVRPGLVIATGGGLFLGVLPRTRMKRTGVTVWLDVPLEVIRSRLGSGAGRPLWESEDPVEQRATFERKRAAYAVADLRVEGSEGTPDEVASRVLDRLNAFYR